MGLGVLLETWTHPGRDCKRHGAVNNGTGDGPGASVPTGVLTTSTLSCLSRL